MRQQPHRPPAAACGHRRCAGDGGIMQCPGHSNRSRRKPCSLPTPQAPTPMPDCQTDRLIEIRIVFANRHRAAWRCARRSWRRSEVPTPLANTRSRRSPLLAEGNICWSTSGCTSEYGGCKEVIGAMACARSICSTLKLETPIQLALPSRCNRAIVLQPSSSCLTSLTGQ